MVHDSPHEHPPDHDELQRRAQHAQERIADLRHRYESGELTVDEVVARSVAPRLIIINVATALAEWEVARK